MISVPHSHVFKQNFGQTTKLLIATREDTVICNSLTGLLLREFIRTTARVASFAEELVACHKRHTRSKNIYFHKQAAPCVSFTSVSWVYISAFLHEAIAIGS